MFTCLIRLCVCSYEVSLYTGLCTHTQLSPLNRPWRELWSQQTSGVCNPERLGIKAGQSGLCTHLVAWQMVRSKFFQVNLYNGDYLGMHVLFLAMPHIHSFLVRLMSGHWGAHTRWNWGLNALLKDTLKSVWWESSAALTSPSWEDFPSWSGIWNDSWSQSQSCSKGSKIPILLDWNYNSFLLRNQHFFGVCVTW